MIYRKILGTCTICLFVTACNIQEQTTTIKQATVIKTAPGITLLEEMSPEKSAAEIVAPEIAAQQETATMNTSSALNLSVDNMHFDQHIKDDDFLNTGTETTDKDNTLFETLNKNKTEPRINLSGKLFTDEDKLDNKVYLKSVDGVQINIEGSFN